MKGGTDRDLEVSRKRKSSARVPQLGRTVSMLLKFINKRDVGGEFLRDEEGRRQIDAVVAGKAVQ